ncbi:MAG TPA: response regulator, partial [Flavisolibacter sp.]|nr:response regulator [Flavisolibacter sp.]
MHRTILLAEDDLDDQELLEEALLSLDANVKLICFTSGVKFIENLDRIADNQLPSLIVLDYNIPELNGAEILKRLNGLSRFASVSKVIWSTSNSPLFSKTCLDLGAKEYIIKPASIEGIKQLAEKLLSW